MKRTPLLALALLAGGCSLILEPDRDAIIADLDAGPDAQRPDGGSDAGPDAGDAGCIPEQAFETSCNDDIDNDCDSLKDCLDLECGASGYCCAPGMGGAWMPAELPFGSWRAHGTIMRRSADNVIFGSSPQPGALVLPTCAPLAFGMHLQTQFRVPLPGASETDFASLLLAPVDDPRAGSFLSDFAVRVGYDGFATAERAGTVIGRTPVSIGTAATTAIVDLAPGVDDAGRAVLFVSAYIGMHTLVTDYALMPLSDLRGDSVGCTQGDGLFIVVEGRGTGVQIVQHLQASTGDCESPTQFREDTAWSLGGIIDEFATTPPMGWREGGIGEPALTHFGQGSLVDERVDLFVDAATVERSDELLRFIDFSIGGVAFGGGSWNPRTLSTPMDYASLLGPTPFSSREPSVFAPNEGGVLRGSTLLLAFARANASSKYEIAMTEIGLLSDSSPGAGYTVLRPQVDVADCEELRDPSIIALGPDPIRDGVLVFFTCDPIGTTPPWIGAAHLIYATGTSHYEVAEVHRERLTTGIGNYAEQGVLSPEVIVTGTEGGGLQLRVWFLARSSSGRIRVALAYGVVDAAAVPVLSPFGGNPILDPEDPILGGACPLGCSIGSLGVMRTSGRDRSYVFLIERSVFLPGGVDHQLIPLSQPRPNDG